jgi:hypothetical protein
MRIETIDAAPEHEAEVLPEMVLTFRPYIEYLRRKSDSAVGERKRFLSYALEKFDRAPELNGTVDVNKMGDFPDLLKIIYISLTPLLEDENAHYWAICQPLTSTVFYGTDAFFSLVGHIAKLKSAPDYPVEQKKDFKKNQLEFCYGLILQKFFGIPSPFAPEMVYPLDDVHTGITRFYKLNHDSRFIEIFPVKELPNLEAEIPDFRRADPAEQLALLQQKLPLNLFRFEGIGILSIEDITPNYATEIIKNILLATSSEDKESYYPKLNKALKTLVNCNDIEFGLFPMLLVNNKLIFDKTTCRNSMLVQMFGEEGLDKTSYTFFGNQYFLKPKLILLKDVEIPDYCGRCSDVLKENNIHSYGLLPIYFNNKLAGLLEIYTHKEDVLDEKMLTGLEPALPYISQIFQRNIDDFNHELDNVIKSNFTAIQPSVQWKFNDVAWHYLRDTHHQASRPEMENIIFEKVYPLYGAVDIRNSTIERNEALRKDLHVQFTLLLNILKSLKEKTGLGLIDEKVFTCEKWLDSINVSEGFNEEGRLNEFIENEIVPFLSHFRDNNTELSPVIDTYFAAINEKYGEAYKNRRDLELSMKTIISSVNKYMSMMETEIQQAYPCYFEKFRTDGVEYDIYIGQSIAPERPFNSIYLNNLRLLQISSMAAIARYAHSLIPQLKKPIETTQLIFIHSHPIDIRFRRDEKRFDVEGAYNIRYHIVKKRIDKVRIKDTKERLTVPNKIALAYFSQKEADEYIGYINYLQKKNVLLDDLEMLELEPLQGVFGLRALRVGIVME